METQASVKTKCDGCGATLGSSTYSNKRGSLSIYLPDGQDDQGYDKNSRYDYCGEACMLAHLQNRAKQTKASVIEAKASVITNGKGLLELDVTQSPDYLKAKAAKVAEANKKAAEAAKLAAEVPKE